MRVKRGFKARKRRKKVLTLHDSCKFSIRFILSERSRKSQTPGDRGTESHGSMHRQPGCLVTVGNSAFLIYRH